MTLLGSIGKGATLAGGQATLADTIGGDTTAVVGQLTLNPNARVSGNLTYWSEEDVSLSPQASVSGQVVKHVPPVGSEDREMVEE